MVFSISIRCAVIYTASTESCGAEVQEKIIKRIRDILEGLKSIYGIEYEYEYIKGYPVLINNEKNIPAEPMAIRSDVIITIYFLPTLSAIKPMGKAIINPPAPVPQEGLHTLPIQIRI